MQHINLVSAPFGRIELPAVGPDSVRPASTKIFVALSGCGARLPPGRTIAHSGRGTGFPESVLRPALPLALTKFHPRCVVHTKRSQSLSRSLGRFPCRASWLWRVGLWSRERRGVDDVYVWGRDQSDTRTARAPIALPVRPASVQRLRWRRDLS